MKRKHHFSGWAAGALFLLTMLFMGCSPTNSNTAAAHNTLPASTSGCSGQSVKIVQTTGTVNSTASNSFTMATQSNSTVQVTYDASTIIRRESETTSTALQTGAPVKVAVAQNKDQTYTALTIVITDVQGGLGTTGGMNGGGTPPAGAPGGIPSGGPIGTPGNMQGSGNLTGGTDCSVDPADPTTGQPTINGTLQSINGTQITVLDITSPGQAARTIALTSATKFVAIETVDPGSIQSGMQVVVSSAQKSGSQITALALTIIS